MSQQDNNLETIPVGSLGIVALESSKGLGKKVNDYIVQWRTDRQSEHSGNIVFKGYKRNSYLVEATVLVSVLVKQKV